MANSFLGFQNPTTTDKKLDTEELTVGANTVHRERVQIAGAAAAEISDVTNSTPGASDYGLVTRPLAGGDIAHDSADSGNPVKIGGKARTSDPSAVANDDRVNALLDKIGRQVVAHALPENLLDGIGNATNTSDTEVIAAQGAGVRIYVTALIILNTSATDTHVIIKDGSTEKMRVPAPADNAGAIVPLPTPLQLTANTALNFAAASGVSTMYVAALGYKGA